MRKRRSVPVEAVQVWKDNAEQVNAFLKTHRSPFTYHANPHGGWQWLHGRYGEKRGQQPVWVGSWLVVVPEVNRDGGIVNIGEREFGRLYR